MSYRRVESKKEGQNTNDWVLYICINDQLHYARMAALYYHQEEVHNQPLRLSVKWLPVGSGRRRIRRRTLSVKLQYHLLGEELNISATSIIAR